MSRAKRAAPSVPAGRSRRSKARRRRRLYPQLGASATNNPSFDDAPEAVPFA